MIYYFIKLSEAKLYSFIKVENPTGGKSKF